MSSIARHIDTCTSSNPLQHESHLQKDRYIYDIVPLLSLLMVAWQSSCVKKILWCNRGNIMETKVYDGPSHQGTACDYTTQRDKMLFSWWYSFCKTRWRNHMWSGPQHYTDVIMTTMTSQITSLTVVYLTVYSDADQRKHQSSASLAFVWGIRRDRWIPRTKGQVRGKCFHLMTSSWTLWFWGITPSPLGFSYWNYAWTLISNQIIMSWILHFEMRLLEQEICHLPSVCVSKVLNSLV